MPLYSIKIEMAPCMHLQLTITQRACNLSDLFVSQLYNDGDWRTVDHQL